MKTADAFEKESRLYEKLDDACAKITFFFFWKVSILFSLTKVLLVDSYLDDH